MSEGSLVSQGKANIFRHFSAPSKDVKESLPVLFLKVRTCHQIDRRINRKNHDYLFSNERVLPVSFLVSHLAGLCSDQSDGRVQSFGF